MIEVAVGIARRGKAELDKALDRLSGELESKLTEILATGLKLVGDEGRRLLAFLPLFPAGNFQPEAMQAACAWADRTTVAGPTTMPTWLTFQRRLACVAGRLFGKPWRPELDGEPDAGEDEAGSKEAALDWAVEGTRQLERAGFLGRDQKADLFTFHETLRDHAERMAPLPPEKHAASFLGLFNFYADYLFANSGNDTAIDRCFENALTLMEKAWAVRPEPGPLDAVLASMVDALGYYFERRGLWQLGDRWNERAISLRRESASGPDEGALAHELYRRASLLRIRGQHDESVKHLRESLELHEKAGNLQGQAASVHELAIIERAQGNPAEARRLLQRSLAILERLGDPKGQAASVHELAIIERAQGNPAEARRLLQRSLAILERLGDPKGQAASVHELAIIERAQGNPAEARRLLQRSLAILERLGDLKGQAASVHELAIIERAQGNPAEARRLLQRSLAILERLGDLKGQAASVHELAIIERAQGNPAEARRLLQRSLAILERLGDLKGQAASLHQLAIIEGAQGNRAEARRLLEWSIHLKNEIGDVEGRATSQIMLAQLEAVEGNLVTAIGMARESVRLLEGIGNVKVPMAREILAQIETFDPGESAEAPSFLWRGGDLLVRAKAEGELAAIDSGPE